VALAVWAGLATAAILLLIDGVWAGRSLVRNLTVARSELGVGVEAIVTGDPEGARPHFEAAAAAAHRAAAAADHPALGLAGLLPVAGTNLDAAARVAAASTATAEAGAGMVGVARTLGWTDIALPASAAAGSLDVDALVAAAPQLDAVVSRLDDALTELEGAGADGLIGPVATGYRDAVELLARRADLAARLRDGVRLAPALFGGDRTHRYLLVVTTLGVAGPGGGTPSTAGILVARDGELRLETLGGVEGKLSTAPPELREIPMSPDWPTTAARLIAAAQDLGAPRLEGAISLDAVAMQDLVWIAGDVRVPRRDPALSDATTANALEVDAFLGTRPVKAAQLHAAWSSVILSNFLERRPGVETLALAGAGDAHGRHLLIYAKRDGAEDLVRSLGLDGGVPRPADGVLPVIATWRSTEPAHVGVWVSPRIRATVRIRDDGSASVLTEVSFDNGAGTDPPSVLLGAGGRGVPVGTFAADVTLYVPAGSRQLDAETSVPSVISVADDLGFRTVTGSVAIRGGASATLTVHYVVKDAVVSSGEEHALVLRLLPQPTLSSITYAVQVIPPTASAIDTVSPDLRLVGETAMFSGGREGPLDLEVRYLT
jgi:hypothetical protein